MNVAMVSLRYRRIGKQKWKDGGEAVGHFEANDFVFRNTNTLKFGPITRTGSYEYRLLVMTSMGSHDASLCAPSHVKAGSDIAVPPGDFVLRCQA